MLEGAIKEVWVFESSLFIDIVTEDGRSMTTFYYYSINQSGLQRNTFSKLSYILSL